MGRTTSEDAAIMRECQRGLERDMTGPTGAWCRDRSKCYAERRCYLVARVEAYWERVGGRWPNPPRQTGSRRATPDIRLPGPRARAMPEPLPDRLLTQLAMEF